MIGRLISSSLMFLLSFNALISPKPEFQEQITTVLFAGDVMLGRSVMGVTPFEKVAGFTRDADITFVNLESPIVENCPRTDSGLKFCTDPRTAQGLYDAGVDVVTLANNHSGNYGEKGFVQTKKYLDEMGIIWLF